MNIPYTWIGCDCGSEAVSVAPIGHGIPLVELAIWRRGRPTYGWRERLRHVWHALTTTEAGEWGDQMELDAAGVAALIAALTAAMREAQR